MAQPQLPYFKSILTSPIIAGIPTCHYQSHLHNFENKYKNDVFYNQLVKLAEQVLTLDLTKNRRYIFLCGGPGSGKTHFMVGLYRAMVAKLGYAQGDGALFVTFTQLAEELIGYFQENIPLRTALAGYEVAKWLFIDDFTSSERVLKENSLEFNTLRDLLLDRYEKNYVLITSSNLSSTDLMTELDRLYGGYVSSRLSESAVIGFPNKDFRKVK